MNDRTGPTGNDAIFPVLLLEPDLEWLEKLEQRTGVNFSGPLCDFRHRHLPRFGRTQGQCITTNHKGSIKDVKKFLEKHESCPKKL